MQRMWREYISSHHYNTNSMDSWQTFGLFYVKGKKKSLFVMNVIKEHLRALESEMRKIWWCHGAARVR